MAPTERRVAKPERRWGCRRGTPSHWKIQKKLELSALRHFHFALLFEELSCWWSAGQQVNTEVWWCSNSGTSEVWCEVPERWEKLHDKNCVPISYGTLSNVCLNLTTVVGFQKYVCELLLVLLLLIDYSVFHYVVGRDALKNAVLPRQVVHPSFRLSVCP